MFTNKKSELTRVQSLALSIAQWSIVDFIKDQLGHDRSVFFTQVTIETVSPRKLEQCSSELPEKQQKAFKLKAHFTTLDETPNGREGQTPARPYIEAELLFKNDQPNFYLWEINQMYMVVVNLMGNHAPWLICYNSEKRLGEGWTATSERYSELVAKEERFETFFKMLSKTAPWGAAVLQDK